MVSPDSVLSESRILDFIFGQNRETSHLFMYHTYILKLNDGSYYVGSTSRLEDRLKNHDDRKVKSTKNNLPFELIYNEKHKTRCEAQSREYQIKKWKSRKAIERLINTK